MILMGINVKEKKYQYAKIMLEVIRPNKEIKSSIWQLVISIVVAIIICVPISAIPNTVEIFSETVSVLQNIFIAFIAMEMGAYALFQALLKKELVYKLYINGNILDTSNSAFLGVILLFWVGIMLNIILVILFKVIPPNWTLFSNNIINILVSFVLMTIYMSFYIRVLFEVRNFAINLFKVFQAHNKVSLLEYLDDSNKK